MPSIAQAVAQNVYRGNQGTETDVPEITQPSAPASPSLTAVASVPVRGVFPPTQVLSTDFASGQIVYRSPQNAGLRSAAFPFPAAKTPLPSKVSPVASTTPSQATTKVIIEQTQQQINTTNIISNITFQTNGSPNASQTVLNMLAGQNITLIADGSGGVTISATPGVELETNGTPNGSQTLLNLVASSNITLTDNGSGSISIAAIPGAVTPAVQAFTEQILSGPVSVTASTLTTIDSVTVTFPSSGGPWRVLVRYQYYNNGGIGFISGVSDGSNPYFAVFQTQAINNNSALSCSEISPQTYANGAIVTFAVNVFGDGGFTVVTTPSGEGSPSRLFNMGVSHMSIAVLASV